MKEKRQNPSDDAPLRGCRCPGVRGAGRFVLGLCDAVELIEGDELRKWVLERVAEAERKFTAPCHS